MGQVVHIDSLDTARLACPACHKERVMQLSGYNIKQRTTKVRCRCRCGHSYIVTLIKEIQINQDKQLLGTFISKNDEKCSGKMIIKKLNSKGIMLRTNMELNLLPGLKLLLEFVLDDPKQSIVEKEVIVKARKGRYLSAEFLSNEHADNLGPYLFFNKLYI